MKNKSNHNPEKQKAQKEKEARLSKALRDNLRRRKAVARKTKN